MTTTTYDEGLDRFFANLVNLPLLSAEEEKKLAIRIAGGDKAAREQLVVANIRLVAMIAKHYKRSTVGMDDLMQEGLMGLMRAAEKFEVARGFRFSTYATWWIRQYIMRAIPNLERHIYLPAYVQVDLSRMHQFEIQHERENGEPPTLEEIASHFEKSQDYIEAIQRADLLPISLERPIDFANSDETATLADFLEDQTIVAVEESVVSNAVSTRVQDALEALPTREADVIRRRYGLDPYGSPQTFEVIAKAYSVSKQRIQQLVLRGQLQLKRALRPLAVEEELIPA